MNETFDTPLAYLAFAALSALFLVIAYGPSWMEWLRPSDTEALRVLPNYSTDIDHFSDAFRHSVMEQMRLSNSPHASAEAPLEGAFEVLPSLSQPSDWSCASRPLISMGGVTSAQALRCTTPAFVHGDLDAGAESDFDALLVQGELRLGQHSAIRRWAHADGAVALAAGCKASCRVSSMLSVNLAADCCFERVQAPTLNFGLQEPKGSAALARHRRPAELSELPGAIRQTAQLTLIRGDCKLPHDTFYVGSLIVTGRLMVGAGTEVIGDIKARHGIVVGSHAQVMGSLTSEKQIQILEGARVLGPVISETVILIGADVELGRPDAPTTVTAETILVEAGACAHGAVWAREGGVVWAA
jgi:hypothetical protein